MKIYITRHGQTDFNKADIIQGTTDNPLNETGLKQADELAEKVYQLKDVDIIISSPMIRAYTTAKAAADKCGLEIVTDERLREWNYGEYEGKSCRIKEFAESKLNFGVRMGRTGESVLQLAHRVYSALDEIKEKYKDKNVLIVCHGGICRIAETYFHDLTVDEYANWFTLNCEIREYEV